MPRRPGPFVASGRAFPYVLIVLLVAAVAIGGAASVIVGAPSQLPYQHGSNLPALSDQELAFLFVGLAGAAFVLLLYRALTSPRTGLPSRVIATVVVGLVMMIVFVAIAHLLNESNSGPLTGGNNTASGNNTTMNGTTIPNGTENVTGGTGEVMFFHLSIPTWAPLLALFAVALIIAIFAAPPLAERIADLREERNLARTREKRAGEARAAFAAAVQALDEGSDPRTVVQALYARLLARVEPLVGGVDTETPEEIRSLHLIELGIGEEPAGALTRLFEEARYSTHAMSLDAADRARDAIRSAEADLDRRRESS